jgi:peptidoglycan/xylan/chitin deacetylase (PgdA/CDA1 family)
VAFWVAPNVEHYEYLPRFDGVRNPWPRTPYPDVQGYSSFDYGNRVGFWRMLDVLDRHRIRCTVSLNLSVLYRYPEIAAAMMDRGWEFMSHGFDNTAYITTFDEVRERAWLRDNVETHERYTGRKLEGFFGPSSSCTARTPDLLAELGFLYHCDFAHDDQPTPLKLRSGRLISVPYSFETNDGPVLRSVADRRYFARICKAQFDRLYREGGESGRVMCLAMHPCWTGQPHRIDYVDEVLDHVLSHDGVWHATAAEIAHHYYEHCYEAAVTHAASFTAAVSGLRTTVHVPASAEVEAGDTMHAHDAAPAERRPGMDHEHYDWSPIVARPPLTWPGNARLALVVIVALGHVEWAPPPGSVQAPTLYTLGAVQRPIPELWSVSHREYGHRIGIFRVLDALEKHGIRATLAIDAMTARHYAWLVRHCLERGCEPIAHGISASRMITSRMSEAEERAYIAESISALRDSTGRVPAGWLGPEYGESMRTPRLLAEAGIRYVCDWANDEQPYRMNTAAGELYALPSMLELDDAFALRDRRFRVDEYCEQLKEAFDAMYRDAAASGRLLVLNLHPWLMGQPLRIDFLEDALAYMMRRADVWAATGSEIIEAYRCASRPPA